jgi:hypothetical protein
VHGGDADLVAEGIGLDQLGDAALDQLDAVDDGLAPLDARARARLADGLLQGSQIVDHEDDVALLAQHLDGQDLFELGNAGFDVEDERRGADQHRRYKRGRPTRQQSAL